MAYMPKAMDVFIKHFQRWRHTKATTRIKQKVHTCRQILERYHDENFQKAISLWLLCKLIVT